MTVVETINDSANTRILGFDSMVQPDEAVDYFEMTNPGSSATAGFSVSIRMSATGGSGKLKLVEAIILLEIDYSAPGLAPKEPMDAGLEVSLMVKTYLMNNSKRFHIQLSNVTCTVQAKDRISEKVTYIGDYYLLGRNYKDNKK